MSSAGSGDRRPTRRRPKGVAAQIGYFLTAPMRWWSEASARRRARKARQRAAGERSGGLAIQRGLASSWGAVEGTSRQFFRGVADYATTRNGVHLLLGLPAILVFVGTVILGILAFSYKREELIKHYTSEAKDRRDVIAKADNKHKPIDVIDEAAVCYERWAQLDPRNDDAKYECALTMYEYPDPERKRQAVELMKQLAPYNRPGGNLKAHEFLAKFHQAQAAQEKSPERQKFNIDMVETHWMRVLILDPNYVMAHINLANLYMNLRRFDRAEWHYKYILDRDLDDAVYLALADVYLRTGRQEEARQAAAAARDHFTELLDSGDTEEENVGFRLKLAMALTILKKYTSDSEGLGAIEVLIDGNKLSPNKLYLKQLADIHLARMADLQPDDFEGRLQLYDEIIRYDPYNVPAFQYLASGLRRENPLNQMTQQKIDEIMARTGSATFYFLLSNKYLQEKNYELAKRHLESAIRLNPSLLVACNNFAYLLVFRTNPPDYDRAMEIIDGGLKYAEDKQLPEASVATFYDTRGQIFVAKGEYQKGIVDLQKAVDLGFGKSLETIETHKSLMKAYQALGQTKLADEQSRLIKVIEESAKKKTEEGAAKGARPAQ